MIILSSLLVAFFVSELIIYNIVGYPKRTESVKYVLLPNVKNFEFLKLKEPHSKYWSVEAGNKVYKYNNLSVTGKDVTLTDKSKIIFVLGDSFVEASSVPPDSTATSVFQNHFDDYDSNYKVINLGFPNSDPYTSYFISAFFEKKYKPEYICLLISHLDLLDVHLQRHPDTIDFRFPDNFGNIVPETKVNKFLDFFRKRSSIFSLFSASLSLAGQKKNNDDTKTGFENKNDVQNSINKLRYCLIKYKEKYGEKFWVLSLEENDNKNNILSDVCKSIGINYSNKKLMTLEFRGGNFNHLNIKGNKIFGEFLYESFIRFYKK